MDSSKEDKILAVIATFKGPKNTDTLYQISKREGVCYKTVKNRMAGMESKKEASKKRQILTPEEELLLEDYIVYLARKKNSMPSSEVIMKLAGEILRGTYPSAPDPSRTWLENFNKRSQYLKRVKTQLMDQPRIKPNGEKLIESFFERLEEYEERFGVTLDRVYNLDECAFKVGESMNEAWEICPESYRSNISNQSSELVTVMEVISATGKILTPLFIYKDKDVMKSWVSGLTDEKVVVATSNTAFINSEVFLNWFNDHFPVLPVWQILILDGCKTHTNIAFHNLALKKRVIPVYLPAHMPNILQSLDRKCFSIAKINLRKHNAIKFASGIPPTKLNFMKTYFHIRTRGYCSRYIKNGWKRAGIYPRDIPAAIAESKTQMNMTELTETDPVIPGTSEAQSCKNKGSRKFLTSAMDSPSPFASTPEGWAAQCKQYEENPKMALAALKVFHRNDQRLRAEFNSLRRKVALAENKLEKALNENRKKPRLSSNLNDRENPLGEDLEGFRDEDSDDSDIALS